MYGVISGYQQITPAERLKLKNIEEGATKNSTDAFLLSRANHTGNMSIANVQDTPSRMAMTIHEKNKLEAINVNATANDTDANLRNRATHTGTQSADTIVNGVINAAFICCFLFVTLFLILFNKFLIVLIPPNLLLYV